MAFGREFVAERVHAHTTEALRIGEDVRRNANITTATAAELRLLRGQLRDMSRYVNSALKAVEFEIFDINREERK